MVHCLSADVPQTMSNLSDCFADVSGWCASKRLQLKRNQCFCLAPLAVSRKYNWAVMSRRPVPVSSNQPTLFAQLTMRDQVILTIEACSLHLRRLRSVRQLLGRDVAIQLVVALVFLHLDYCNAVLAGLPATTLASSP